jgi:hypothetical protein
MASKYWVGGGANTAFGTAGNWAASSGGAGGAGIISTDDAIFDGVGATANGVSVVSSQITVLSLNMLPGFTGTLTFNARLIVGGNITLGENCTISGTTGPLEANATVAGAILTSNGKVLTCQLIITNTLKVLGDDWTVASFHNSNTNTINGNTMYVKGNITLLATLSGTTQFVCILNTTLTGPMNCNLKIAGNLTFGTGVVFGGSKLLEYESGTVTQSNTFSIASFSLDTSGCNFFSVNFTGGTNNFLSQFNATTITILGTASTFPGLFPFVCNTLNCTAIAALTITFKEGVEYKINTAFASNLNRRGTPTVYTSAHATLRAIFNLAPGATCNVSANFTRIDASPGRAINSWNGVITDCININSYTDLKTVSSTF